MFFLTTFSFLLRLTKKEAHFLTFFWPGRGPAGGRPRPGPGPGARAGPGPGQRPAPARAPGPFFDNLFGILLPLL